MPVLELSFASGERSLDVRRFSVHEGVSSLFDLSIWAVSRNDNLDLDSIVGQAATFSLVTGYGWAPLGAARKWTGMCSYLEQTQPEAAGVSTYFLRLVPTLWMLTQRRNYRVYQHLSIPDIVDKLLGEWGVDHAWEIDRGQYPKLEYKIQYGETDYAFVSRLVEEAGIAFYFPDEGACGSKLTFNDQLHANEPRKAPPLVYMDNPNEVASFEHVTRVTLAHQVRPGAHTLRDYDFRNPSFYLLGQAAVSDMPENRYEQYTYEPGAMLIEGNPPGDTPVADDKGVARHKEKYGVDRADRDLRADRINKRVVSFDTNVVDLWPGLVTSIMNHPHAELDLARKLLLTEFSLEGTPGGEWTMSARAVFADPATPYRPPPKTPKPKVQSVQSATVVGPRGQEIHTDEFGRVRVQFPWDREGKMDDFSSCWIRVSTGWAGTGFGMIMTPRIGQEVLVGFLEGDPDQPIITGRVFNAAEVVPYKLPDHKTRSTWKSDSTIGSGGFNEIMFEDLSGKELIYEQAQKNMRKLVKNDETITIGHDRKKYVMANELETTGNNRTEVTGMNRTEITLLNRTTIIGKDRLKIVHNDEYEKTEGNLQVMIGRDQDVVITQNKRERVVQDSHLRIEGERRQRIEKTQSLTVGQSQQEKVGEHHALEAGKEIHLKAGTSLILEAARDLTLKGPGGFIRIDGTGITIKGTLVKINSGGSAGSGSGSHPTDPDPAKEAVIAVPPTPEPEDINITKLGQ
jgi:type VI secretion system secreted protein VgrG